MYYTANLYTVDVLLIVPSKGSHNCQASKHTSDTIKKLKIKK